MQPTQPTQIGPFGTGGGGDKTFETPQEMLDDDSYVTSVNVYFGDWIDAVVFTYYSRSKQRFVTTPPLGNPGGRSYAEKIFSVAGPDEFINGVTGRADKRINSIKFVTNKGNASEEYEGSIERGGGKDYKSNVGDEEIIGVWGKHGEQLDTIGFYVRPHKTTP